MSRLKVPDHTAEQQKSLLKTKQFKMKSTDLENRCLTLLIWHRVEIRDKVNVFSCSLNVRSESSMIPRSLTMGTGATFWPRKEL